MIDLNPDDLIIFFKILVPLVPNYLPDLSYNCNFRVEWTGPPPETANGVIKGYKIVYGPSRTWYVQFRRGFLN